MTITQLEMYNGALRLLKEERLALITEAREARYLLDDVWNEGNGGILKACLEEGGWTFAKRSVRLDYDSGVSPQFGYPYACVKPDDFVRLMNISADDQFQEPLNQYNEEGGYFFTPFTVIYLRYVSKDASYGGDMSKWPNSFIEFMKAYMASKIVGKVTNAKVSHEDIMKEKARTLAAAQGKDAIGRPAQFPSRGSWVGSRAGMRGRTDSERSR